MRAMILAAGRGERMRPLTDTCPKALLRVADRPLIAWHILRLVRAGLDEIIINHAWLGAQIEAALGDGAAFGAHLSYSAEATALETAGGIARALPYFQGEPFLVINADVWCDWDPAGAPGLAAALSDARQAHLLLADNPAHHPQGDFALLPDGHAGLPAAGAATLTYTGIGIYHPGLFAALDPDRAAPLAPLLYAAAGRRTLTGQHHRGTWMDVGTPARLEALDRMLRGGAARPC